MFAGQQPERWLVHLLVTRDPTCEGEPAEWDWDKLLKGGDPVVIHSQPVGYETEPEPEEEPCLPESSLPESS